MLLVCIMLFLPLIFANAFCSHALSWFIDTQFVYFKYDFSSCAVLLICWFFVILCSHHFLYEIAMCLYPQFFTTHLKSIHCHNSTAQSYVTYMLQKKPSHTRNIRSSSYTMPLLNRPADSKATLGDSSFSFAYACFVHCTYVHGLTLSLIC